MSRGLTKPIFNYFIFSYKVALLSLYECFILESGGIRSKSGDVPRISRGYPAREEKQRLKKRIYTAILKKL